MNPPPAVQAPTAAPQWPHGVRLALIEADGIADAAQVLAAPGAILLEVAGSHDGILRGPA
jgi:hypothetical protein